MTQEEKDKKYMEMALEEARKAFDEGEIPIGAVVVAGSGARSENDAVVPERVVARCHNLTETLCDVTAHAEMQAITAAANTLGGKYLTDCTLYVTVEPCPMCAGALGWAQLSRVVYGCGDEKRGYRLYAPRVLHPKTTTASGILEEECRSLMQDFFKQRR
jgi:tRNA(adenine34) deaminase